MATSGVVVEEADESAFYLELFGEARLLETAQIEPLLAAAEELTRLMTKSRQPARRNS
jgi:hypothetical protein